jgi:hypothetical protein
MVDFLEYEASSKPLIRKDDSWNDTILHTGSLSGNALKDIIDKGVENGHRLV